LQIIVGVMSLITNYFLEIFEYFLFMLYAALPYIIFSISIRIYAHFLISGIGYSSILLPNYAFHFFLIIGKNCEVKNCHSMWDVFCNINY
jgi:hypothetical protein